MHNAEIGPNTSFDEEKNIQIGDNVGWKGLDSCHRGVLIDVLGETAHIQTEKGIVRVPESIISKIVVPAPKRSKEKDIITDSVPWEPDNGLVINV